MKIVESDRGFRTLVHPTDTHPPTPERLVAESSAIGPYPDAADRPGSSFLYVGHHTLNREQVADLIVWLQCWLRDGRLPAE